MGPLELALLGTGILLLVSVLASKLSTRLSLPALVLFLLIGMLAGSEGIGGIYFDDPQVAQSVGVVALIFILFSGGLSTSLAQIRPVLVSGILLSTVGVLLTAGVVAVFAALLLAFSPLEALLVGAITAATDAAAVFSILRTQRIGLKGNTVPLLEFESGSNDPMAIFLTISAIQLLQQPDLPLLNLAGIFVRQMSFGVGFGLGFGYAAVWLLNRLRLEADGLYPVLTTALVLLTYTLTALPGGSGFLAVYIVGLVMANRTLIHQNSLARFHDALSWLMQIMMFLVLGLLVFPSRLPPVTVPGVLIAMILIFVARPVSVFTVLLFSRFDWRDKLMISWVGLRGATPIVLATFPLLAGIPQSDTIFNIVFFTVLVSVLLQGSSLVRVAHLLRLTMPLVDRPRYPLEPVTGTDLRDELVELEVAPESPAVDRQIVRLGLPDGCLIVLIARGPEIVLPNGNTVIEAGDVLLMLADKAALPEIRQLIAGSGAPPHAEPVTNR